MEFGQEGAATSSRKLVFNQDVVNMPEVQIGLKGMKNPEIIFANYGETKPRHFHMLLEQWLGKEIK